MVTASHLLDDWAAAWDTHDMEKLASLFTDDCVYEDVTFGVVNHGKDELKDFANGFVTAFPDLKLELKTRFVAGELAGAEWISSGTHKGDLPGMPATGKRFWLRAAGIMELRRDKIKRCSEYWDMATFLKQLGLTSQG